VPDVGVQEMLGALWQQSSSSKSSKKDMTIENKLDVLAQLHMLVAQPFLVQAFLCMLHNMNPELPSLQLKQFDFTDMYHPSARFDSTFLLLHFIKPSQIS
jgi:hypothetical protein